MAADRVDRVLSASGLPRLALRRSRSQLGVLAYHGVDDPAGFAAQLDWLVAHRRPVGLAEAIEVAEGRAPSDGAVLVTFDDGHRSVLEDGLPRLRQRGIPAVAFVVVGLVGTSEPFWWSEVEALSGSGGRTEVVAAPSGRALVDALKRVPERERRRALTELRASSTAAARAEQLTTADLRDLEAGGVVVGSHTLSHALLDRCDEQELEQEVGDAHDRLAAILGRPPEAFAYPNGNVSDAAVAAVRRAGHRVAFTFDHRLNRLPVDDALRVSRLRVGTTTSPARFEAIVSGLHPTLHHARGRS